jgi:hypothetical protein
MYVRLTGERVARVGFCYGTEKPDLDRPIPITSRPFRSLTIRVTILDEEGREIGVLEGKSFCNPSDQFCKRDARKYAMRRLFSQNREAAGLLSLSDCHILSPVLLNGHR